VCNDLVLVDTWHYFIVSHVHLMTPHATTVMTKKGIEEGKSRENTVFFVHGTKGMTIKI